jgi:hypothetical protein
MLRSDLPIELPYNGFVDYDDPLGVDMDQVAKDIGAFIIPFRCQVILAGAVVTETCGGETTTPVVDFDKRPTAGSDTDRGAADIGHLILSTTAAGKIMYDEAARGTVLEPGEEVVFELAVAATGTGGEAGHVRPFLLVQQVPEVLGNLSDMVETA